MNGFIFIVVKSNKQLVLTYLNAGSFNLLMNHISNKLLYSWKVLGLAHQYQQICGNSRAAVASGTSISTVEPQLDFIREFSFQFRHYLHAEPGGNRRNYSELFGNNGPICRVTPHKTNVKFVKFLDRRPPPQIIPEPALLRMRTLYNKFRTWIDNISRLTKANIGESDIRIS